MMMSELANPAELTQHVLFIALVAALAMQLSVLFGNLQQQPTCIKNIKGIICSGDPIKNIRFLIIKMRKRSSEIFRGMATVYKSDQL